MCAVCMFDDSSRFCGMYEVMPSYVDEFHVLAWNMVIEVCGTRSVTKEGFIPWPKVPFTTLYTHLTMALLQSKLAMVIRHLFEDWDEAETITTRALKKVMYALFFCD